MSDHNQVKMTEMNYDKDRPKAENPLKIEDLPCVTATSPCLPPGGEPKT